MDVVRVLLQERQRWLREGLTRLLDDQPDLAVVAAARTGPQMLEVAARLATWPRARPAVALVEADATRWNPHQAVLDLRHVLPGVRVVGLCDGAASRVDREPCSLTFDQFVSRRAGIAEILGAIRGEDRLRCRVPGILTPRETQVLRLVADGWTAQEIADQLGISDNTVRHYREGVLAKLGVQSQAHAVAEAIRRGLLDPTGDLAPIPVGDA